MTPTEGAFERLCRSLSMARVAVLIADQEITTLRSHVVAALLSDAESALIAGATVH